MSKAIDKPPVAPSTAPVEYTLPIPHEHAGESYPAGHKLTLYPDQIALIEAVAAQIQKTAK